MHVMLDLETFGTRPGSAFRSVGACLFDPAGDAAPTETFYSNVSSMSCWRAGMTVDGSTIDWWKKPEMAAADEQLKVDAKPIQDVVPALHAFFRKVGGKYLWSQGASFDGVLWSAACKLLGVEEPWKFWDTRCTRTIYAAAKFDNRSIKNAGTAHNALDDCIHQVKCVQASYKIIASGKK